MSHRYGILHSMSEGTVQHAGIGKRNGKQERAEGNAMRLDSAPTVTLSLITTKGNVAQKVRVPQHALRTKQLVVRTFYG